MVSHTDRTSIVKNNYRNREELPTTYDVKVFNEYFDRELDSIIYSLETFKFEKYQQLAKIALSKLNMFNRSSVMAHVCTPSLARKLGNSLVKCAHILL